MQMLQCDWFSYYTLSTENSKTLTLHEVKTSKFLNKLMTVRHNQKLQITIQSVRAISPKREAHNLVFK